MLNFVIIFIFLLGSSASAISQPQLAKARFALTPPNQIKKQLSAQELNGELQVIEDENLKACIKEIVIAQDLDSLQNLTKLKCVDKNIEKVNGIKILNKLITLNLKSNKITSIGRLLYDSKFPNLKTVNVLNNPDLSCSNIENLEYNSSGVRVISDCSSSVLVRKLNFKDPNFINSFRTVTNNHPYTTAGLYDKEVEDIFELTNRFSINGKTSIYPVTSIGGIEQLTNLRELELYGAKNYQTFNLNPLKSLTNLRYLMLKNVIATDWNWDLPEIRSVSSYYSTGKNYHKNLFDAIANGRLPNLEELTLKNRKLESIDSFTIDGLENLFSLDLNNLNAKEIKLINNPNLTTINFAGKLDKLEIDSVANLHLSLSNIRNLEPISPIANLRSFSCNHCQLESLSGFPSDGSSLQELSLHSNNLKSLQGLPANLPFLNNVTFASNQLTNLNGLNLSFNNFAYLNLTNNHFTNLSLLNHLSGQINWLGLDNNLITNNGFSLNLNPDLYIENLSLGENPFQSLTWINSILKTKRIKNIILVENSKINITDLENIELVTNGYGLNLSSNKINKTAKFLGSNNGGEINLTNNLISDLNFLLDERDINLSKLILKNNLIDTKDLEVFNSSINQASDCNIEVLDLSYNKISNIDPLTNFLQNKERSADSFRFIDLSFNQISKINNLDLSKNKNIFLILEHNQISTISSIKLDLTKAPEYDISTIDLSHNLLVEMPIIDIISLNGNLLNIHADNNRLTSIRKLIDNFKKQTTNTSGQILFNFRNNPSIPKSQIKELKALGFTVVN